MFVSMGVTANMLGFVNTTLGQFVRELRSERGMAQGELATAAGMPQPALSDIERDRIKLPNADIRRRLAKALGVSHLDLLVAAGTAPVSSICSATIRSRRGVPSRRGTTRRLQASPSSRMPCPSPHHRPAMPPPPRSW